MMYKKRLAAVLPLLLMAGTLHAEEQFPFIGASVSYQQTELENGDNSNHTTGAFHVGKQTLRWRTTFGLEYGQDLGMVTLNVDYIPFDTMFGTPKIRPYLGANINYIHYKNDAVDDSNGYSYGAQTGFILYATDRIDIDIGYHYNVVQKIEGLDTLQGATLSLHYFY